MTGLPIVMAGLPIVMAGPTIVMAGLPIVMAGLDPAIARPHQRTNDAVPVNNHRTDMAGSRSVMMGIGSVCIASTDRAFGIAIWMRHDRSRSTLPTDHTRHTYIDTNVNLAHASIPEA